MRRSATVVAEAFMRDWAYDVPDFERVEFHASGDDPEVLNMHRGLGPIMKLAKLRVSEPAAMVDMGAMLEGVVQQAKDALRLWDGAWGGPAKKKVPPLVVGVAGKWRKFGRVIPSGRRAA